MKIELLNKPGPENKAEIWRDYDALYSGGEKFRERIGRFLHQNPQEPHAVYEARKREAVYRSYIGTVIDYFAALLFASPLVYRSDVAGAESKQPEWFADFGGDVDGAETDLVEFMRRRSVDAMVRRRGTWRLDFPAGYGASGSKAEADRDGSSEVKLAPVLAEDVIDCARDDRGRLLWAIVHARSKPRPTPETPREDTLHTWYVLDRETVRVFQATVKGDDQPNGQDNLEPVREVRHELGDVPLVELDVGDGLWVANRIESAQLEHFRLSSANNWSIRRTCYAMPVFKLADPEAFTKRQMGAGYYITLNATENEEAEWMAPPTAHISATQDEVKGQKDEIFRLVTQMSNGVDNNAASVGRSGDSKLADAEAIQVVLRSYGALVRDAIKKTLNLLSKARGEAHSWTIEGLDKFDTIPPEVLIELLDKASGLDVPSRTFAIESKFRAAVGLIPGADQATKEAIRKEITDAAEKQEPERGAPAKQLELIELLAMAKEKGLLDDDTSVERAAIVLGIKDVTALKQRIEQNRIAQDEREIATLKRWSPEDDRGGVPGNPAALPKGGSRGRPQDGQNNAGAAGS